MEVLYGGGGGDGSSGDEEGSRVSKYTPRQRQRGVVWGWRRCDFDVLWGSLSRARWCCVSIGPNHYQQHQQHYLKQYQIQQQVLL